jgi:hypothetical protein
LWQKQNGNPLTDVLALGGLDALGYGESDEPNGESDEYGDGHVPAMGEDGFAEDILYGKGHYFKPGDLIEL